MGKKHKHKKAPPKVPKPNIIEKNWQKIAIGILLLLPFLYFSGFLFNSNKMIGGSDFLIGAYPYEKWTAEQKEIPLWQPNVVGGVPGEIGASVFGGPLRLSAFFRKLGAPPHIVLAWAFFLLFFGAGIGTYFYLKDIGLSPYTAAVGAVIYQFIGNLATSPDAGHMGRAASIAMFPVVLFFVNRGLKLKQLKWFIYMAFFTAFIVFFEGNIQITYYGLLFIFMYGIYYLIARQKDHSKKERIKIIGYGLFTIALICILMAVIWLPVIENLTLKMTARGIERGYEYASSWSLPPHELIDLFIPSYSGILENYWGLNHFKIHLEYFGLVALIFALLTFTLYWRKPYVKFFTIAIIPVLIIALGGHTPFFKIFYTIIPGFKLFRAPALIFYLISFCFTVLGAIGFENIFVNQRSEKENGIFRKKFYIIAGILLLIFLIIGLICAAGRDSIIESMQESFRPSFISEWGKQTAEAKLPMIRANFPEFINGIWRSLIFIVVILGLIYLSIKRKIKIWILTIIVICITLIDQLPLMTKYLPSAPGPETYYVADDAVRVIKRDRSVFRVFPTPWYEHASDLYLLYHDIQSAGGYMPNPLQRYQDFIGAGTSVMFSPANFMKYPQFLNMFNIKYLIGPTLPADVSQYDAQTQRTIEEISKYFAPYALVFRGQRYSVFLNNNRLPRAYIVPDYEVLSGLEILDRLKSPDFDPRQVVILEYDPHLPHPEVKLPFVTAEISSYKANKIVCTAESPYAGFLVLTDNWHPDWKVFVDGEQKKLYRANYTFRAVPLEPGKHEVVFAYISDYFNIGRLISIIALILSIAFCIIAVKFKI